MTYQSDRDSLSRQSLHIVELDLDTKITAGGKEYLCDGVVPFGQTFYPCVNNIQWVPTRAAESGGLGLFGQLVIDVTDFPYPGGAGTYFGRLLANNEYYLDRLLKVWVGFYRQGETFSFSNFQERRFFIKRIVGPDQNKKLKIEAVDILSLLKDGQVPPITYGQLNAALNNSATGTINIQDNTNFVNATGYAIINDEIVQYTSTSGSDSIVFSARGQLGTKADEHDADDSVRMIYVDDDNVVNAIRTLIEDYTNVDDATYIPDTDWNTQRDDFLSSENVALRVLEPTEVDVLIDEMGQYCSTNVWWDEAAKEIKLEAIGPTLTPSVEWDDNNNILDERIILKRDQKKILTQVWYFYGKVNPTKGDNAENYSSTYVRIDSFAEAGLGTEKIKKIFAKHIPDTGTATASKVTSRLISQNSKPIELTLMVDAKDSSLDVGDSVDINSDIFQDTSGANAVTKLRIIEKIEKPNNRYQYKMLFSGIDISSRYATIGPDTLPDYTSSTEQQRIDYGWISDDDDEFSNGDPAYLIL